jgi:uncharacterized membrane protein YbhN (UPF0104 family)
MQLATSFLNIALPSAAARMGLNVRFFQRQGVPPGTAVTSGLIDSFIGNVVQAILLGAILIFSSVSLDVSGESGQTAGSHHVLVVVAVIAVTALVLGLIAAVAIGRIRRVLIERWRAWWPDVRAALGPLHSPHKLAQIVGGNLAAELLFAGALALLLAALHSNIGLVQALTVNLAASLLAMFIPIPGGIGVVEGAMIVGLTSFGVDQETAFAGTILYRISTFYLPPIWGWFAMHWLERNRYV